MRVKYRAPRCTGRRMAARAHRAARRRHDAPAPPGTEETRARDAAGGRARPGTKFAHHPGASTGREGARRSALARRTKIGDTAGRPFARPSCRRHRSRTSRARSARRPPAPQSGQAAGADATRQVRRRVPRESPAPHVAAAVHALRASLASRNTTRPGDAGRLAWSDESRSTRPDRTFSRLMARQLFASASRVLSRAVRGPSAHGRDVRARASASRTARRAHPAPLPIAHGVARSWRPSR